MKRLITSHLTFESDTAEDAFIQHVLAEVDNTRKLLGVQSTSREYQIGSMMWRWDCYQQAYEQDFEFRRATNMLFKESNLSLNLPLTAVSQHGDKMSNDLLATPAFFAPAAEGSEDENPAVDILMQRLKARAKTTGLNTVGKQAMDGALIRGQEIMRAGLSEGFYMKPALVSSVKLEGKDVKDSSGAPVRADDVWVTDPAYPDRQFLERDKNVWVPVGAPLEIGKPKVVMQRISKNSGAEMTTIYFADFFIYPNAESLDASPVKGHVFSANPGDLLLAYDPDSHEKTAFDEYDGKYKNDALPGGEFDPYTVRADSNRLRDGETDDLNRPATSDVKRFRRRTYADVWIRYDADGDGYAEDIYCLIDLEAKIPVHYEYAALILPWNKSEHPHPYICQRIWPKLKRWTGRGYYELLDTFADVSDRMLNRIEVDAATSGNVVFENPLATMQGIDGEGIQFRTGLAYQLRSTFTADDALSVKTVQPANVEIFNTLMEQMRGRAEISAGLTSPAEATVADVPGQDTLGVAKILENTSNQSLRARETEIVSGLTEMLKSFISIEIYAILNTESGQQSLIEQVGPDKAAVLLEWAKSFPDKVSDVLEVSLTKAHSSQMIEVGQAIINALNSFAALPTPMQAAMQGQYANILKGIGEPNPEQTLAKVQEASAIVAEQQAAAMAAEAASAQPPTPPVNR